MGAPPPLESPWWRLRFFEKNLNIKLTELSKAMIFQLKTFEKEQNQKVI